MQHCNCALVVHIDFTQAIIEYILELDVSIYGANCVCVGLLFLVLTYVQIGISSFAEHETIECVGEASDGGNEEETAPSCRSVDIRESEVKHTHDKNGMKGDRRLPKGVSRSVPLQ